jgi:hypothetical protein
MKTPRLDLVEFAALYGARPERADVNALKAAKVHGPHIGIRPRAVKWMYTAFGAEIVPRNVPVELVDAEFVKRRHELEIRFFDAADDRAFLGTNGAIADDAFGRIKRRSKLNLAAVTCAIVGLFHDVTISSMNP